MHFKLDGLHNKAGSELTQAFTDIDYTVTTLDLSYNHLDKKASSDLAQAFATIPRTVTTLNLSNNHLYNKSGAELAQAFAAIPRTVTTLDLTGNYLDTKTDAELAQAFSAIPAGVKVNYGNDELQKKYDINCLLNSYLKERTTMVDSSGSKKNYFYGGFFTGFQKSFTQKKDAVTALQSALNGNNVDLSEHLSTLTQGNLGKQLQAFVKSGMGNAFVGKEVNTVHDFVQALQDKNCNQAQLS